MNGSILTILLATVAALTACGRTELSGPPTLRLARDECTECGMLVNEDRCSCALLINRDGRREHLVFDDIGCLLDFRLAFPETVVVDVFVHDHSTGAWVSAPAAHYLSANPDELTTPMGSGYVAFASAQEAAEQHARVGGELTTLERLTESRRASREARHQPPMENP